MLTLNRHYAAVSAQVFEKINFRPLRNKSFLVTGANGMIGSHILAALALASEELNLNVQITALSRSEPTETVASLKAMPGFRFTQADLAKNAVPNLDGRFDYIIHAATYGQPKKFLENPLDTMKLNGQTTCQLLELAAKNKASFLFLSSGEIYGNPAPEEAPVNEDYPGHVSPLDERASYTSAKRFGETLCKVFAQKEGVRARIARVTLAYGPGARINDDRVINVFLRSALARGEIRLMDKGLSRRKWLYIADALAMLFYILIESKELVYNVGGAEIVSIADLARLIGQLTGAKVIFPEKETELAHTKGAPGLVDMDITRIMKEAGIAKLVPLKEALPSCIEWTREMLAKKEAPR